MSTNRPGQLNFWREMRGSSRNAGGPPLAFITRAARQTPRSRAYLWKAAAKRARKGHHGQGGRQQPANGNPVTLVLNGPIPIRPLSRASLGDSGIGGSSNVVRGAVSLNNDVHHQPTYLCQSESH